MWIGLAAGGCYWMFSVEISLEFYGLIYLLVGALNGLFEQLFFDEDIKLPLFLITLSEFLYGIVI